MNSETGSSPEEPNPNGINPWQRWGNFLESHPRLWRGSMVGTFAVGVALFGTDVADMIINEHVTFFNAEMVPVSISGIATGVFGARYVQRNHLSEQSPEA